MNIPTWRLKPVPVLIRCDIKQGMDDGELVVQFTIDDTNYVSFVPEHFVDREQSSLRAVIVADYENSWLVDIPTETLTSGRRLRVPKEEQETVVRTYL